VIADGRQPRFVAADQLAQAVNLDMADWWTPTGESYLGRVKKDQILVSCLLNAFRKYQDSWLLPMLGVFC